MTRGLILGAVALAAALAIACRPRPQADDPLGPNAGCYVCHMTFVGEPLSTTHLREGIGCVRCHGVSAPHANDENIGVTKPDVIIRHGEVNAFCRTCHGSHDVAPEKLIARWRERFAGSPAPAPQAACTDCHGAHKIARAP